MVSPHGLSLSSANHYLFQSNICMTSLILKVNTQIDQTHRLVQNPNIMSYIRAQSIWDR